MNVFKGKLEVTTTSYGGSSHITIYNVIDTHYDGFNVVSTAQESAGIDMINEYYDVDLTNTADLDSVFNLMGTNTYKWLTPMTEIPSQGGGSGITALDVYPVGAEFTTTDTTFNPMKVWGGTWTVSLAGAKRVWTRTA